jgi:hypothetical protein
MLDYYPRVDCVDASCEVPLEKNWTGGGRVAVGARHGGHVNDGDQLIRQGGLES